MARHACLSALAAIFFANLTQAHMVLKNPVPYSLDKNKGENGPITAANFPCKTNFGFDVTTENTLAVGQSVPLEFYGSAIHGGGGCQLSVTLDRTPTASSKFKVIKSFEGGCPTVEGDNSLSFSIPDSIPNGKATFAWSWFSKLSGAPEMYMNCAPITVTGGASDDSKFNALPDMLVANIATADCTTPQSGVVKFANPGDLAPNADPSAKLPTGSGCPAAGSSSSSSSGSSSGSGASSGSGSSGSASSAAASGSGSKTSATSAAPKAAATTAASNGGGVFAPGAASSAAATPTSLTTTLVTVTASSSPAAATTPASGSSSGSSSGASSGSSSSSSSGGSTCSSQGQVICNGSTQFGLCNNGNIVWQAVAPGTTCSNGVIQRKRDVYSKRDRMYHGRIMRPRHNHWSS